MSVNNLKQVSSEYSLGGRCCKSSCRLGNSSWDQCVSVHEQSKTFQLETQKQKKFVGEKPAVGSQWIPVTGECGQKICLPILDKIIK